MLSWYPYCAAGHIFGEWQTVIAPTLDDIGLAQRTCTQCGEVEKQILPKLDEEPTVPTNPTEPTIPTEPTQPPTEPTVPTEPTQPPTKPAEPTQPTETQPGPTYPDVTRPTEPDHQVTTLADIPWTTVLVVLLCLAAVAVVMIFIRKDY